MTLLYFFNQFQIVSSVLQKYVSECSWRYMVERTIGPMNQLFFILSYRRYFSTHTFWFRFISLVLKDVQLIFSVSDRFVGKNGNNIDMSNILVSIERNVRVLNDTFLIAIFVDCRRGCKCYITIEFISRCTSIYTTNQYIFQRFLFEWKKNLFTLF